MKLSLNKLETVIRKKCLDCSGEIKYEVEKCLVFNCPLFPYRMLTTAKSPKDK